MNYRDEDINDILNKEENLYKLKYVYLKPIVGDLVEDIVGVTEFMINISKQDKMYTIKSIGRFGGGYYFLINDEKDYRYSINFIDIDRTLAVNGLTVVDRELVMAGISNIEVLRNPRKDI